MEKREDEFSREQLQQIFIRSLANMFNKIVEAEKQPMILGFVKELERRIQIGSTANPKHGSFTTSHGFKSDPTRSLVVAQLAAAESAEARKNILLDALADKDKCGLEEEYLK